MSKLSDTVTWSGECYSLSQLNDEKFKYPLLVKAECGNYTATETSTISAGQRMLLHGWERRARMVARNRNGLHVSIPIEDEHTFEVYRIIGEPAKLGLFTLKYISRCFELPVVVRFDPRRTVEFYIKDKLYNSKEIGLLDLTSIQYQHFVNTSLIDDHGVVGKEVVNILPSQLMTPFLVGISMEDCSADQFHTRLQKMAHRARGPDRKTTCIYTISGAMTICGKKKGSRKEAKPTLYLRADRRNSVEDGKKDRDADSGPDDSEQTQDELFSDEMQSLHLGQDVPVDDNMEISPSDTASGLNMQGLDPERKIRNRGSETGDSGISSTTGMSETESPEGNGKSDNDWYGYTGSITPTDDDTKRVLSQRRTSTTRRKDNSDYVQMSPEEFPSSILFGRQPSDGSGNMDANLSPTAVAAASINAVESHGLLPTQTIHTYEQIPADISDLGISEISDCLILLKLDSVVAKFAEEQIDGILLKVCTAECFMNEFGLGLLAAQKLALFAQGKWRPKR